MDNRSLHPVELLSFASIRTQITIEQVKGSFLFSRVGSLSGGTLKLAPKGLLHG